MIVAFTVFNPFSFLWLMTGVMITSHLFDWINIWILDLRASFFPPTSKVTLTFFPQQYLSLLCSHQKRREVHRETLAEKFWRKNNLRCKFMLISFALERGCVTVFQLHLTGKQKSAAGPKHSFYRPIFCCCGNDSFLSAKAFKFGRMIFWQTIIW